MGGNSCRRPSLWHVPRFPIPRKRASVQPQPYCLHKLSKRRDPLLHLENVGTVPKPKFPGASLGPALRAGPLKSAKPSRLLGQPLPAQLGATATCEGLITRQAPASRTDFRHVRRMLFSSPCADEKIALDQLAQGDTAGMW